MTLLKSKKGFIRKTDKVEENWNVLFDQIVKGNVIPVIGPELVELGGKTSVQQIIDVFSEECGIDCGEKDSFSQLVYDDKFQIEFKDEEIHKLIRENIKNIIDNCSEESDNIILRKFLSIKYFPFVITTLFDPIVENIMRELHGDKLRILCFRNDPNKNDDLFNSEETKSPTLYYMFGKADGFSDSFVVTDSDMLRFSRAWMLPADSATKAKPSVLSSVLSKRYLLVLGYDYQDWLFRFFWYAMKSESLGQEKTGMLAHSHDDQGLIEFLTRAKAFTQVEPDMNKFVDKLNEGIQRAEAKLMKDTPQQDIVPEHGTDVFISYSRGDKEIVEELFSVLISKGLHVWYDKQSMYKGLDFLNQIENAVKRSSFFVPIFTDTIIKQADKEHPYRLEWKYATDHISLVGGVPYCYPFFEENFDMDNLVAAIPKDLKRHDAFSFSKNNVRERAEELADCLIKELERRRKNG